MTSHSVSVPAVLRQHVAAADNVPTGICTACMEIFAVDGSAVLLMPEGDGRWQVAAAVGRLAGPLAEAQLTAGEGPAFQAYLSGRPVLVPDVTVVTSRWPGFVAAVPPGVRGMCSLPLRWGVVQFGALDMYRCAPGGSDGPILARALQVAVLAAEALIFSATSAAVSPLDWLGTLPGYVAEMDQAAGMSSVQLGVSLTVAYARLRGYAFGRDRSLADVAREVVDGSLRLDDDRPYQASGGD